MGTYKVIQDIEAEDKLLGPLTLKQFIYAIIVVVCGFVAFKLGTTAWYLALPFLPPMIVFGALAAPLGRDQPTEVWLLAKLRYFLKPRLRIWDQSGQLDYVTITVPKKVDASAFIDNLSQSEVKSRLKTLGETIDSRGWAIKNVQANAYEPATTGSSDRLLQLTVTPTSDDAAAVVKPDDDILDEKNNPVAQQLGEMISASTQSHRQATIKKMQTIRERMSKIGQPSAQAAPNNNNWFMPPAPVQSFAGAAISAPSNVPIADDEAILTQAKNLKTKQEAAFAHHKLSPPSVKPLVSSVTAHGDPAILELAHNDDLNVATIARQAKTDNQSAPDEVTVSLH